MDLHRACRVCGVRAISGRKPWNDQSNFSDDAALGLGYGFGSKEFRHVPDGSRKGDWDRPGVGCLSMSDVVAIVTGDGRFWSK